MSRTYVFVGGLAALAALGAVNVLMAREPLEAAPLVTAANAVEVNALSGDEPAIEARSFSVRHTRDRPLFSATRRVYVAPPPAPPAAKTAPPKPKKAKAPPPAPPAPPPSIRLHGVKITPDGSFALVSQGNSRWPEWLPEGTDIRGWSLSAIRPAGVEISSGNRQQMIELHPTPGREVQ
jgi:hypothetical protein